MVVPLFSYHLEQKPFQLPDGGQGFHFQGATSPINQGIFAWRALQTEAQSAGQDL